MRPSDSLNGEELLLETKPPYQSRNFRKHRTIPPQSRGLWGFLYEPSRMEQVAIQGCLS